MKVLLVTAGNYSDYHVVAVFSEDHAEEAENLQKRLYSSYTPLVLPMNPVVAYPTMSRLEVRMDRDGNSDVKTLARPEEARINEADVTQLLSTEWRLWKSSSARNKNLQVFCWARDDLHAVKIANEYRQQLLVFGAYELLESKELAYIDASNISSALRDALALREGSL